MDIIREAFNKLFPEKPYTYTAEVLYSGKFKGYNARIQLQRFHKHVADRESASMLGNAHKDMDAARFRHITLKLSKNWRTISRDIQLGLAQHLLCRLFKQKRQTTEMDLYTYFIKSVPATIAKTKSHPVLEQSFKRVNEQFFDGLLDQPNLVLGKGITKLGHYDLGTDTVSLTGMLLDHEHLLDYVMYHELLHKKHQFSGKGVSHRYHTHAFRKDEHKFPRAAQLEKELSRLVSSAKRRSLFSWF